MSKLTFEVNEKEYVIPEFLTIENYVKIFKVKDLFEDEYMKAKVINLVTGCPMEDLINAENHQIDFLSTSIFALFPDNKYPLYDKFTLDGVEYGYIPSYKEITFGEFVDLDTLLSKKPEEIMDYLHIVTAIMYRPITKQKKKHDYKIEKYNSDTVTERSELFKSKLNVKFSLGGQFFFINFVSKSPTYTQISLIQRIQLEWMMMKFVIKNWKLIWRIVSKKGLGGTLSLTGSQIRTLLNMKQFYKNPR